MKTIKPTAPMFSIILQKQYAALVWISRPLEEEDCNSVSSMKELVSHTWFLFALLLFFFVAKYVSSDHTRTQHVCPQKHCSLSS